MESNNKEKLLTVHKHHLTEVNYSIFQCNVCARMFNDATSNCCRDCNFDMCQFCAKRISTKKCGSFQFHPVKPGERPNDWICNNCKTQYPQIIVCWCCTECEYDCCVFCFN